MVRILTPWPEARDIPAGFFDEANGPTKIGVIREIKRTHESSTQYVVKTADGKTHTLTRDKFATSAVVVSALDAPPFPRKKKVDPQKKAQSAPPAQNHRLTKHSRPRRRGNFADIARIKEANK